MNRIEGSSTSASDQIHFPRLSEQDQKKIKNMESSHALYSRNLNSQEARESWSRRVVTFSVECSGSEGERRKKASLFMRAYLVTHPFGL